MNKIQQRVRHVFWSLAFFLVVQQSAFSTTLILIAEQETSATTVSMPHYDNWVAIDDSTLRLPASEVNKTPTDQLAITNGLFQPFQKDSEETLHRGFKFYHFKSSLLNAQLFPFHFFW